MSKNNKKYLTYIFDLFLFFKVEMQPGNIHGIGIPNPAFQDQIGLRERRGRRVEPPEVEIVEA